MKLPFILIKNIKVVLRNWVSVLLLILGPMLLILLIGIAFSGETLNEIKVGYYAKDTTDGARFLENLQTEEGNVAITKFRSVDDCTDRLKVNDMHICIKFSEDFSVQDASGTITFYYDNSRVNLVKSILAFLKERVGITSEEIMLETTRSILNDIESTVIFMYTAREQILELKTEAARTKQELVDLRTDLQIIKDDFDPVYANVKSLQSVVEEHSVSFFSTKDELDTLLTDLNDLIISFESALDTTINITLPVNQSLANLTNITTGLDELNNISSTILDLTGALKLKITETQLKLDETENDTIGLLFEFEQVVLELDRINAFLNKSLIIIDKDIELIDDGLVAMDNVIDKLDESSAKFLGLSEDKAEQLVKPINTHYTPILGESTKIYLIFPVLLVFIIMFISILLSNMVVQNEIFSSAFFRNFLLPVNNILFITGLFLTNLLVVLFQVAVLLLVAYFKFRIDVFSALGQLSVAIILVSTVFVLIGMIFAYMFRTRQSSVLVSIFTSLGLFLFSDIIFPIEIMPELAFKAAKLNPLVIGEEIFREILFFKIPLAAQIINIRTLVSYIIVLIILVIGAYYYNKKKR